MSTSRQGEHMITIEVEVTQDDIDQGVPESYRKCPLALALRRMGYDIVEVFETSLECAYDPDSSTPFSVTWKCKELPGELEQFISLLDEGNEVFPTTFEIPLELKS